MGQITREIGNNYALVLFGVDRDGGRFCGSGTLVRIDETCYVLTAAHVWEQLKKFPWIGTTLKEGIYHRFLVRTDSIDANRTVKPDGKWGEWGPDLSLLRIPSNYVTSISAHKGFYNLRKDRPLKGNCDTWVLLGAPHEKGRFLPQNADLRMRGNFSIVDARHERNGLDYLDFGVEIALPDVPGSFGGVSGGGLWRVRYSKFRDRQVDWEYRLEGIAFYESAIVAGRRVIRCHGMETVASLVPKASIHIPDAS